MKRFLILIPLLTACLVTVSINDTNAYGYDSIPTPPPPNPMSCAKGEHMVLGTKAYGKVKLACAPHSKETVRKGSTSFVGPNSIMYYASHDGIYSPTETIDIESGDTGFLANAPQSIMTSMFLGAYCPTAMLSIGPIKGGTNNRCEQSLPSDDSIVLSTESTVEISYIGRFGFHSEDHSEPVVVGNQTWKMISLCTDYKLPADKNITSAVSVKPTITGGIIPTIESWTCHQYFVDHDEGAVIKQYMMINCSNPTLPETTHGSTKAPKILSFGCSNIGSSIQIGDSSGKSQTITVACKPL